MPRANTAPLMAAVDTVPVVSLRARLSRAEPRRARCACQNRPPFLGAPGGVEILGAPGGVEIILGAPGGKEIRGLGPH